MFETLKYHRELRRLQSRRRALTADYTKRIEEATKAGKQDDREDLIVELFDDQGEVDDDIAFRTSQYLREQAQQHLIPVPEFDTNGPVWVRNKSNGYWRLSSQEQVTLRSAIRKERKERWELWQMRLTLVIGFGGVLIGLVSVVKK